MSAAVINNHGKARTVFDRLFNPFYYIAGAESFLIGLAAIFFAGVIAWMVRIRFNGIFDVHAGANAPFWLYIADGFINWLSISVLLLIAAVLMAKSFRAVDLFGTMAMSRWPSIVAGLLIWGISYCGCFHGEGEGGHSAAFFTVAAVITLLVNAWMAVLMYHAYSISCNIKGGKALISFLVVLIIAEFVSVKVIALL
jgi:hypothetical protein